MPEQNAGAVGPVTPEPGTKQPPEAPNVLARGAPEEAPANGLTADEETELARLQAKAARATAGEQGTVQLRVTSDHTEMHYGGVRLTGEWTTVPRHMAGPLETAAADSGVSIEQKEG